MFSLRIYLGVAVWALLLITNRIHGESPAAKKKRTQKPNAEKRIDPYGDPLPDRALTRLGTVRLRHGGWVLAAVFSADGKTLTSFGGDDVVRTWEVRTGKQLRRCRCRSDQREGYSAAAFSQDGKVLALGCDSSGKAGDRLILLWDTGTGKELHRLVVPGAGWYVLSLAFSTDGKIIAAGDSWGQIHSWEAANGKPLRRIGWGKKGKEGVTAVAFAPNGRVLASGNAKDALSLWDMATGKEIRALQKEEQKPIQYGSFRPCIAFAPDGKTLAIGNSGAIIRLWDLATSKEIRRFKGHWVGFAPDDNWFHSAVFSADGKTLITDNHNEFIEIWEVATGKNLHRFRGHRAYFFSFGPSIARSPDGKTLASWTFDNAIRLWDLATGKELTPFRAPRTSIASLAFAPDGKMLASGSAGCRIRLWLPATGKELRRFTGHKWDVESMSFSPDGKILAAAGDRNMARLWEVATGKEWRQLHPPSDRRGNYGIQAVAFAPKGRLLACTCYNHVCLRDYVTGKLVRTMAGCGSCCAFSGEGEFLTTAGRGQQFPAKKDDRFARFSGWLGVWDVATGKRWGPSFATKDMVTGLAVAADNKMLATVSWHHSLSLWEVATGQERRQVPGRTSSVAFWPAGKVFAQGKDDGTIGLWDGITGKELCRLEGHQGRVRCLTFSPDGRTLASGSADATILIWDVAGLRNKKQVRSPGLSPVRLAGLWDDLAGSDAGKAYRTMGVLAEAPRQAVPFLKGRLFLQSNMAERISALIADLDSTKYVGRKKATAELTSLGAVAEPALRAALRKRPSLEVRMRVEQLLRKLPVTTLPPERLRVLRAVEVLEYLADVKGR